MLVAWHKGERVEARDARRELAYVCPRCEGAVLVKRGRIRVAHFAHRPQAVCDWASGETPAHLAAKAVMRDAFAARGLRAEVEYVVPELAGDRRADVMVWSPGGAAVAIELQHTSITLPEIEARAASYAQRGIAQIWVPILRASAWNGAQRPRKGADGDWLIERYAVREWELWICGLAGDDIWFYDPRIMALWRGRFGEYRLWVREQRWIAADHREVVREPYSYPSRRWRSLTLWGPVRPAELRLQRYTRAAAQDDLHRYPAGPLARFILHGHASSKRAAEHRARR